MRFLILSVLIVVTVPASSAQLCTTSWENASGGAWNSAANWSEGAVPGPTDNVCVVLDGTYTVTHTSGAVIDVQSLTLGAPSGTQTLETTQGIAVSASSLINANGVLQWTSGALTGGATTTNNGQIVLDGAPNGSSRRVDGAGTKLVNAGTVRWESGLLYLEDDGALDNTGTIEVDFVSGSTPRFFASGNDIGTRLFDNAGTISILDGSLEIQVRSRHDSATLTAAADATLLFSGSNGHTFAGTTTGTPAGTIAIGVLNIPTPMAAEMGAVWNLGGTGIEWRSSILSGGQTLTNTGLVVVANAVTGAGRGVSGAGTVFANTGMVRWEDDDLYLIDDGAFSNEGTIRIEQAGASLPRLNRVGTDNGSRVFTNAGALEVASGKLEIQVRSRHEDATLTASAGATLELRSLDAGDTHVFAGTTVGTPAGDIVLNGAIEAETGAIWNVGGTGVQWQSSVLEGGETLTSTGTVVINGTISGAARGATGIGTAFANAGTVTWGSDEFYLLGGAVFSNSGTLVGDSNGGQISRLVEGTGSGRMVNTGAIDIQTGLFEVEVDARHDDATISVNEGATLVFDNGTHTFAGTLDGTAAGDFIILNNPGGLVAEAGAVWNVDGVGIQWDDGILSGNQTLTNSGTVVLNGDAAGLARGASGLGTVFRNTGTVLWTSDEFYLIDDGAVSNEWTWRVAREGNVPRLEPSGTDTGSQTFTNTGIVEVDMETFDVNTPFVHQSGTIRGNGELDLGGSAFTHTGDTAPGLEDETGILTWKGKPWAPPLSATLTIEIGGTTPGMEHDQLAVSTTATLGGTLVLSLIEDAPPPSAGDAYTVLTASSFTGTFDTVSGPPGYVLSVAYNASDVVVTIVEVSVVTQLTGAEGWRMIAPSVNGQTFADVLGPLWTQGFPGADYNGSAPVATPNVFLYSEATVGGIQDGYATPGSLTDDFDLGTSAFVYVYSDDDFDGTPEGFPKTLSHTGIDASGAFTFGVTYTSSGNPDDDGWNLVGNPYATTLNWEDTGWMRTNMSSTLYVWDPASGQYLTDNGVVGSVADGLVAPAQGFWVQATAASPVLVAPSSARTTGGTFVGRQSAPDALELQVSRVGIEDAYPAYAFVLFDERGEDGRDNLDGLELAPLSSDALVLYSERLTDGEPLDIQALGIRSAPVEIAVGIEAFSSQAPANAEMILTWPSLPAGAASLRDRVAGLEVDLRAVGEYTFSLIETAALELATPESVMTASRVARRSASDARFVITLGDAPVDGEEKPSAQTVLEAPSPNPSSGAVRVGYSLAQAGRARLSVYDMLGREVAVLEDGAQPAGTHAAALDATRLPSGAYLVRLEAGGVVAVQALTVVR